MKNEYRAYNAKGELVSSYGLGWNIAEIMRNEHHLAHDRVTSIDLVISGVVRSRTTREELIKAMIA